MQSNFVSIQGSATVLSGTSGPVNTAARPGYNLILDGNHVRAFPVTPPENCSHAGAAPFRATSLGLSEQSCQEYG